MQVDMVCINVKSILALFKIVIELLGMQQKSYDQVITKILCTLIKWLAIAYPKNIPLSLIIIKTFQKHFNTLQARIGYSLTSTFVFRTNQIRFINSQNPWYQSLMTHWCINCCMYNHQVQTKTGCLNNHRVMRNIFLLLFPILP